MPNPPTPAELIQVKAVQRQLLSELNRKTHWTDKDFEDVFFCHHQWIPEQQEYFVSCDVLRELAFDARTPDEKARKLQQLIGQFEKAHKTGTLEGKQS